MKQGDIIRLTSCSAWKNTALYLCLAAFFALFIAQVVIFSGYSPWRFTLVVSPSFYNIAGSRK
jgi:hypothetical protein